MMLRRIWPSLWALGAIALGGMDARVCGAAEEAVPTALVPRACKAFDEWVAGYLSAQADGRTLPSERQGVDLARERRGAMRELIVQCPSLAFACAVRPSARRALPASVVELLEDPLAGHGDLVVDRAPAPPRGTPPHALPRRVAMAGKVYRAFVYDRLACDQDYGGVWLRGIAVDDVAVVCSLPVRRLEPENVPAAMRGLGGVFAEVEGEIRRFRDLEEMETYEIRLQYPTGVPERTPEDIERLKKRPRIRRVRPNRMLLDRLNEERRQKGLPALDESALAPAPPGMEMEVVPAGASEGAPTGSGLLPSAVDNSKTNWFPPIGDQGQLGSCAAFSTAYYQLTYMTARERGWDAAGGGPSCRFSPKWVYNMQNGGQNQGTFADNNLDLVSQYGCALWSEFPYNGGNKTTNFLPWCTNAGVWRAAIGRRTDPCVLLGDLDTDDGLAALKTLLADGYVVTFSTLAPYPYNDWVKASVKDDPADTNDTPYIGKSVCSYVREPADGGHAMTIVGYSDHIWCDINGNSGVDSGEKGALRIANSWATSWEHGGFTWLAYDALRAVSPVSGAPPDTNRVTAISDSVCYVATAKTNYVPSLLMKFTVLHPKRSDMRMILGIGATADVSAPSAGQWDGEALNCDGGAYAFDGTTSTNVRGTFYLDLSNVAPKIGELKRYFLGMQDSSGTPSVGSIESAALIDVWGGEVEVATITPAANPDQFNPTTGVANASTAWCWVDYTLPAPTGTPSIAVLSPNGGEYFNPGIYNTFLINAKWHADFVSAVNIDLCRDGTPVRRLATRCAAPFSHFAASLPNTTASGTNYTVRVSSADPGGSSVVDASDGPFTIECLPTPSSITISPDRVMLTAGATQQFTAVVRDQWNHVMDPLPPIAWSIDAGGGAIDSNGLLVAGDTAGSYDIKAEAAPVWDYADVLIGTSVKPLVWVGLKPGFETAYERDRIPGVFDVWRSPKGENPVTVALGMQGTASNGVDYDLVATNATISAGAEKVEVMIRPIEDGITEGRETCKLRLASGIAYVMGSPANATLNVQDYGTIPAPPSPPAELTAAAVSTSRIDLAWLDQATNEAGYVVERSPDHDAWLRIAATGANVTNCGDTGLETDTPYCYRVAATNAVGLSAWVEVCCTTLTAYAEWRLLHFTPEEATNAMVSGESADPDKDGSCNLHEFLAGTHPKDWSSCLRLLDIAPAIGATGYVLHWQSATGRVYHVYVSTNLTTDPFTEEIAPELPATPPVNVYTDAVDRAGSVFYRVGLELD